MFNTDGIFLASEAVSFTCGSDVLSFSGNGIDVLGIMWAPNGNVGFSAASSHLIGAIVGKTINISGSDLTFDYDPNLLPPKPPSTGRSE